MVLGRKVVVQEIRSGRVELVNCLWKNSEKSGKKCLFKLRHIGSSFPFPELSPFSPPEAQARAPPSIRRLQGKRGELYTCSPIMHPNFCHVTSVVEALSKQGSKKKKKSREYPLGTINFLACHAQSIYHRIVKGYESRRYAAVGIDV